MIFFASINNILMDTTSSNIARTEKFCDFLQIYFTAKFGLIVQYNTNVWYNSINQGKGVSLFFNRLVGSSVPNKNESMPYFGPIYFRYAWSPY
ncbi:hypothetical protein I7I53_03414 [Histoplasma capsulatum var. duboisii H88]|uniref:Uncharacterized protein n=1 Tax=Ajellomyces capsulatus (strain H88) TaxID=544711 RepID=A0A8A1LQV8_AJEC8|nr:hypothetical protein I7I53_03414 [Histoplasma capsulatum var. duboisii H88]